MDVIGVIGLTLGLIIALDPKSHLDALRGATLWRLGWALVAASVVLLTTATLAPPSTLGFRMPSSSPAAHHHNVVTLPTMGS